MKQFILAFLAFFLVNSLSFGQKVKFDLATADYMTNKRYPDATVKVSKGLFSATYKTNETGRAVFNLQEGKKYKVTVKADGKVSRYFYVDLRNPVKMETQEPANGRCEIRLFEKREGVDYSYIENNPITTFRYNESHKELDYDVEAARKMVKEVDKVLKDQQ